MASETNKMSGTRRVFVDNTRISVFENDNVIFIYDYMDLYALWRKMVEPDFESDLDENYKPEGHYINLSGDKLVICILELADQVGILGIVDIKTGTIEHTQEAAYCCSCAILENKVFTLHLIHHYGVYPYYQVQISKIGKSDFGEADVCFNLSSECKLRGYIGQFNLSLNEKMLLIVDESIEETDNTFQIDVSSYIDEINN